MRRLAMNRFRARDLLLYLLRGYKWAISPMFLPILRRYLPQPPSPPAQNQTQPAPANNPPAAAQSLAPAEVAKPTNATKQASAESPLVVENEFYKITLTNRGAQVKSWILKK